MSDELGFEVVLDQPYEAALDKVRAALKSEGFGVLTFIDVKATFKEKLDKDFRPYAILGACNPPLAFRSLSADSGVGLLLPCNVTVEEVAGGCSRVNLVNPETMLLVGPFRENDILKEVAGEVRQRLERVATALQAG